MPYRGGEDGWFITTWVAATATSRATAEQVASDPTIIEMFGSQESRNLGNRGGYVIWWDRTW